MTVIGLKYSNIMGISTSWKKVGFYFVWIAKLSDFVWNAQCYLAVKWNSIEGVMC